MAAGCLRGIVVIWQGRTTKAQSGLRRGGGRRQGRRGPERHGAHFCDRPLGPRTRPGMGPVRAPTGSGLLGLRVSRRVRSTHQFQIGHVEEAPGCRVLILHLSLNPRSLTSRGAVVACPPSSLGGREEPATRRGASTSQDVSPSQGDGATAPLIARRCAYLYAAAASTQAISSSGSSTPSRMDLSRISSRLAPGSRVPG